MDTGVDEKNEFLQNVANEAAETIDRMREELQQKDRELRMVCRDMHTLANLLGLYEMNGAGDISAMAMKVPGLIQHLSSSDAKLLNEETLHIIEKYGKARD